VRALSESPCWQRVEQCSTITAILVLFRCYAPAKTLTKLSWIEEIVNDLLDPAGRDRRRRAIQSVGSKGADTSSSPTVPATKPAYRRGWLLATVTNVLTAAREPMQARAVHRAAEELAGEPVSWSSVRNCLVADASGSRHGSSVSDVGDTVLPTIPKAGDLLGSNPSRSGGCAQAPGS
jgi:hypothetical protein